MSKAEAITISEASRKDAHNLDDARQRYRFRKESPLMSATRLNVFESLVKEGKIELSELPQSAVDSQVGQIVNIDRGNGAYSAIFWQYEGGTCDLTVDICEKRKPVRGSYEVVFKGPVETITFRHPIENKMLRSTSKLIQFTILERQGKQVAFYDPHLVTRT